MNATQCDDLALLFERALRIPVGERVAYVEDACRDHPE